MRTVSIRLSDLERASIPIGFVGENQHTQVRIDCLKLYEEYPNAAASLTVKPPKGDSYPAIVVRDDNTVVWEITDSDLIYEGSGEIQLSFTVDEVVAKSYIGRIKISRSITPTGEVPEPIDDFLTRAGAALTAIPETIDEALADAKASGEFDGADGVSPTVSVTSITGGHRIVITDAEQTQTVDVVDGENGDDGVGIASISKTRTSGLVDTYTITYTNGNSTTFTVTNGADGDSGTPGHSPVLTASRNGKTTTIYSDGTQLAQISDGEDGSGIVPVFTQSGSSWSCDLTFSQVKTAVQGKQCTGCLMGSTYLSLFGYSASYVYFGSTSVDTDYGDIGCNYLTFRSNGSISVTNKYFSVQGAIADQYDSLSFPVTEGTICFYDGFLYKATQDIATYESFDYSHWTSAKVSDVLSTLSGAITQRPETKATDATNVDLDITDNNGNVVARFKDGQFQTKNFNSSAVISAIESLENAAAGSDYLIPSYWVDTLAAKEQTINGLNNGIGANGVTFLFFTDYHQNSNNGNSLPLMLHVLKSTSVSDVFYGGDTSDGGSLANTAAAEAKLREVANHLKPLNMFSIRGNHDCEPSATVTTNQIPETSYYDMYVRPIENKIKGTGKPYYYLDNETAKVRYICMDSGSRLTNALDSTQITWLKAKLTELTSGWTVVIFQHMVYEKVNTEEQTLITMGQDLLNAIDDVFSNLNCEIACVIAGHCHTDAIISTTHNFKVITTTCDSGGVNAAGDPLYPTRTPGTTLEQAFDVFSIDTVNKTINMTRIGAGVDRNTTY